ncbi:MAG: desulfoferrodoxin [Desulfuromonadaceae bacterium]
MTEQQGVYKCDVCGNIVEVLHTGAGALVCCGANMRKFDANTTDAAQEKHVPVIEQNGDQITVTVGSVEHPMTEEHYIEWIEIIADEKSYRTFLNPGDKPQATFCLKADKFTAREYCNLHGLWKAEK